MKTPKILIAAVSITTFALSPVGHAAPLAIKEVKELEANQESVQSIIEHTKTISGCLHNPIVIKSMEQALEHLTRASMERIADMVDFKKEQVAIFAWHGSIDDTIEGYERSPGKLGVHWTQGKSVELKNHSAVFIMPKGTKCRVKTTMPLFKNPDIPDPGALLNLKFNGEGAEAPEPVE